MEAAALSVKMNRSPRVARMLRCRHRDVLLADERKHRRIRVDTGHRGAEATSCPGTVKLCR